MCQNMDLCKNLIILPELRWHPSVPLGHRMRDEERLAPCLALLLSPALTLYHLSALSLSCASVSPSAGLDIKAAVCNF